MEEKCVKAKVCPLCEEELNNGKDTTPIQKRGADGINRVSKERGHNIVVEENTEVHKHCRFSYTNAKELAKSKKTVCSKPIKVTTRESVGNFNSKSQCLFCGTRVDKKK